MKSMMTRAVTSATRRAMLASAVGLYQRSSFMTVGTAATAAAPLGSGVAKPADAGAGD